MIKRSYASLWSMIKFRYLHWEISVKNLHNMKEMILYIKPQYLYAPFPILMCTQAHIGMYGYVHKCKHTYIHVYVCTGRALCHTFKGFSEH